jgi:septal ring factor EnvC (AmiA/AmiB activator)
MSEERFDRIDAGLSKLAILYEETRDHVKLIAEGLAVTNQRLEATNQRLEATNQRLDATNQRLDATNQRLDATDQRVDSIDGRIIRFERNVNLRFDRIETLLSKHDERITALGKRRPARR